ncbi:GtrA family protein [Microbacterium indicum]|uniref:GtrA family protein n=1 Tax=Microbacterium indicum TaxID=358100 RepID=UPI00055BAFB3|nr:GtrA family protein [Microbacterium indicum]
MPKKGLFAKVRQAGAFLAIGGIAFVIDFLTYNGLVFWVTGHGPMFEHPIWAKIIAIVVATLFTYVGNRYWTFNDRHLPHKLSRYVIFVVVNGFAVLLQLAPLWVSRYVLGLHDPISDNISGTFIGQILATAFRYVAYDRWVFPHTPKPEAVDETPAARQREAAE